MSPTPKCGRCRTGDTDHVPHGTDSGWSYHACRCQVCTEHEAERKAVFYAKNRDRVLAERRDRYRDDPEYRGKKHEQARAYADSGRRAERLRERYASDPEYRATALEQAAQYRKRNPERTRAYRGAYYLANREKLIEASKTQSRRVARKRYRKRNVEYSRQYAKRAAERWAQLPVSRSRTPWSSAEDSIILSDDLTMVEKCYMTGRSHRSVTHRIARLRDPDSIREYNNEYYHANRERILAQQKKSRTSERDSKKAS